MGIKGNDSSEAVVRDNKLYTGIQLAKVVAICPSLKEMNDLGINTDKEPVYKLPEDDEGNKKVAIDFYLNFKGVERLQKLRIFLTNSKYISRSGKKQLIDDTGKTCWDNPETGTGAGFDWFDEKSARDAHPGEEQLITFLINWLNVKPGDTAKLENFSALFDLDFSELQEIFASYKDNKVRCMLTVNHTADGKSFQNVYPYYFDRETNTSYTYWKNHITKKEKAGYPMKDSFSYEFQEYKDVAPDTDSSDEADKNPEDIFD